MTSARRKRLRAIRKAIQKKPPEERERLRKEVYANPHLCNNCWSGKAYFEDRLVCFCWPAEEMTTYERDLKEENIVLDREEEDVRYYKRKEE